MKKICPYCDSDNVEQLLKLFLNTSCYVCNNCGELLENDDTSNETIVFSTKTCPNCVVLKELLKKENIQFKEIDMQSPSGAAELFSNDIFVMQAPVLKFKGTFYTNITTVGKLDINRVMNIIKS